MKTKQEIVDELKKKINDIENGSMIPFMSFEQGAYSAHTKDLKLIEQLDEPQHDTARKIPQIIAKYLELCKSDNFDFTEDYNLVSYDFINHFDTDLTIEEMEEIKMWFYDNDQKENQRRHILFLQAYTYDYEVEEEPKWVVKVGNLYFCGWEDTTAQFVMNTVLGEDESIIKYKNEGTASSVAKNLGGTAEKA
ncbi:DUF1642 domain-containing protein [Enterococcus avium]|uniref:DUF1642 domain-containing protein n=1 Tax=Enterococcus avium TaxID=33945 RepID=UPI00288FBE36|nr:DUF1642 domain-containing protein [Enterococcus avium]MDT2423997.1 DUF1642 domain-containing protein [Enterococcus avium]